MAEDGDQLVFHTSRERYTTSDGLNHQSQLTLIVDTGAMKVLQPVVVDNKVTWYVDKKGVRTFYTIPL